MIFEHNDCRYMKIRYVHSGEETNIRNPRSYKHYWTSSRYLDTCAKRRVEITLPSPLIFASHLNRQFQEVLIEDIIRARDKEDDWISISKVNHWSFRFRTWVLNHWSTKKSQLSRPLQGPAYVKQKNMCDSISPLLARFFYSAFERQERISTLTYIIINQHKHCNR